MAYAASGLKCIAPGGAAGTGPGNVRSIYHYATNDAASVVEADGYFDGITGDPLVAGDIIHATLDLDGTLIAKTYLVSVGGGDVTVIPMRDAPIYLNVDIADLSAEASYYTPVPIAGRITKAYSVIDGAVGTADVTITMKIATVAVTNGVITITQSGSAAGDVDSATPTAANAVAAGGSIELLVTGGGAGGSPRGHVVIEITPGA